MFKPRNSAEPTRADILIAAAKIGCSPPVAEKILRNGPLAARNRVHRERAPAVCAELGFAPPSEPPHAA